jgi:hypothetical protein
MGGQCTPISVPFNIRYELGLLCDTQKGLFSRSNSTKRLSAQNFVRILKTTSNS